MNNIICVSCGLNKKKYAKQKCTPCYDRENRKKGECSYCGAPTCRLKTKVCNGCSRTVDKRHTVPHTEEAKAKMRANANRMHKEKHPMWKGDKAKYAAIHMWVKVYKSKPTECEICDKPKTLELSNKNHCYSRELDDWQYVCRSCHRKYDMANNNYKSIAFRLP